MSVNSVLLKVNETITWWDDNAGSIRDWFDPKTFDWSDAIYLMVWCHKDFNFWFNPDTFDWTQKSLLVDYGMKYIDIWYDSSRFEKSYDELLLESIE
tara:strand:+ start:3100 stop:3390 length:291 start_codon:yes stop_codon:yes gene_type:complete